MMLQEFDQKMNQLLRLPELEQYIANDGLHNGLLTHGVTEVMTVGFGVSASMELFRLAKKRGCQAVVVHHGVNIIPPSLDPVSYARLEYLIKNGISLWGAHFLLDAHPDLGNATQLLLAAGAQSVEPYMSQGMPWGRIGQLLQPATTTEIIKRLRPQLSPHTTVYDFGSQQVQRIACVTGKGAPWITDLQWLKEHHVDLYITGEVHEWNRELFRETELNLIAGGHYHTETFGVKAVQQVVEKEWGLKTVWLNLPNNI